MDGPSGPPSVDTAQAANGTRTMAEELLQNVARDINCLGDDDRTTRRRGLQKLTAATVGAGLDPGVLQEIWDAAVRIPVLKLLADPIEKNRELAIALLRGCAPSLPAPGPASAWAGGSAADE